MVAGDFAIIALLVFIEGILSIDNALVLALLVKPLPVHLHRRALTYGIVGAIVFRIAAIAGAAYLMHLTWVKFVGGGYLLFLAVHHFLQRSQGESKKPKKARGFWATVAVIELTDVAFAVDSILAAVALTPKVWVVITGGIIGMALMRFAATIFVRLLETFPRLETSAYLLVGIIGVKLVLEGLKLPGVNFHSSQSPAFWVFWVLLLGCIGFGLRRSPSHPK